MSAPGTPFNCTAFELHVSDYLEHALDASRHSLMETHANECASCAKLLSELQAIASDAKTLPALTPSHDLWPGIANRLDTPVVTLDAGRDLSATMSSQGAGNRHGNEARFISMRTFAAAAVLLVVVSSGVTWMLTQRQPTAVTLSTVKPATDTNASTQVAAPPAIVAQPDTPIITPSASRTAAPVARQTSRATGSVDAVYEREIRSLRRIVDERLGDLDSVTVVEIERNLAIIDKAIADSRRALERDPRSRFLSTQLDRALENKLAILRRVALL